MLLFILAGFIPFTWANHKFNWGKCDNWPLTEESYKPLERASTIGNFHHPLRARLSHHAVKKNKLSWVGASQQINANCTSGFTVPMDWNSPGTGDQLGYFITKFFADPSVPYKGRVWVLDGGPGGSGQDLYPYIPMVWKNLGGAYDLYVPDHRGTGNSSIIKCPYPNYDMRCVDYVKQKYGTKLLNVYTTYQAALDVVLALTLVNNEDTRTAPTYIYGLSYGTYWLNRILQVAPDSADAVVLDGVCPSSLCRFVTYDLNTNRVGSNFMSECASDAFCSKQFGSLTPYTALEQLAKEIDAKENICASELNITREVFNTINVMWLVNFEARVLIPPFIKRLLRCDAYDAQALSVLMKLMKPKPPKPEPNVLSNNILLSEMFSGTNSTVEPPTEQEVMEISEMAYFATFGPPGLRPEWDSWPKYIPNPRYYDKYGYSDKKILLLNGDLDPQTPHFWAVSAFRQYQMVGNANLNFVTVPRSVHVTAIGAPTNSMLNETCGLSIMKAFFDTKGKTVDTSCVSKVLPIDWEGKTQLSMDMSKLYFGTTNMWG